MFNINSFPGGKLFKMKGEPVDLSELSEERLAAAGEELASLPDGAEPTQQTRNIMRAFRNWVGADIKGASRVS